jgi:hypothetical protein
MIISRVNVATSMHAPCCIVSVVNWAGFCSVLKFMINQNKKQISVCSTDWNDHLTISFCYLSDVAGGLD